MYINSLNLTAPYEVGTIIIILTLPMKTLEYRGIKAPAKYIEVAELGFRR